MKKGTTAVATAVLVLLFSAVLVECSFFNSSNTSSITATNSKERTPSLTESVTRSHGTPTVSPGPFPSNTSTLSHTITPASTSSHTPTVSFPTPSRSLSLTNHWPWSNTSTLSHTVTPAPTPSRTPTVSFPTPSRSPSPTYHWPWSNTSTLSHTVSKNSRTPSVSVSVSSRCGELATSGGTNFGLELRSCEWSSDYYIQGGFTESDIVLDGIVGPTAFLIIDGDFTDTSITVTDSQLAGIVVKWGSTFSGCTLTFNGTSTVALGEYIRVEGSFVSSTIVVGGTFNVDRSTTAAGPINIVAFQHGHYTKTSVLVDGINGTIDAVNAVKCNVVLFEPSLINEVTFVVQNQIVTANCVWVVHVNVLGGSAGTTSTATATPSITHTRTTSLFPGRTEQIDVTHFTMTIYNIEAHSEVTSSAFGFWYQGPTMNLLGDVYINALYCLWDFTSTAVGEGHSIQGLRFEGINGSLCNNFDVIMTHNDGNLIAHSTRAFGVNLDDLHLERGSVQVKNFKKRLAEYVIESPSQITISMNRTTFINGTLTLYSNHAFVIYNQWLRFSGTFSQSVFWCDWNSGKNGWTGSWRLGHNATWFQFVDTVIEDSDVQWKSCTSNVYAAGSTAIIPRVVHFQSTTIKNTFLKTNWNNGYVQGRSGAHTILSATTVINSTFDWYTKNIMQPWNSAYSTHCYLLENGTSLDENSVFELKSGTSNQQNSEPVAGVWTFDNAHCNGCELVINRDGTKFVNVYKGNLVTLRNGATMTLGSTTQKRPSLKSEMVIHQRGWLPPLKIDDDSGEVTLDFEIVGGQYRKRWEYTTYEHLLPSIGTTHTVSVNYTLNRVYFADYERELMSSTYIEPRSGLALNVSIFCVRLHERYMATPEVLYPYIDSTLFTVYNESLDGQGDRCLDITASESLTKSTSPSVSPTISPPRSPTHEESASKTITPSTTHPATRSQSSTITPPPTPSVQKSPTRTDSSTNSFTFSRSLPPTRTQSFTVTPPPTSTPTSSRTNSHTASISSSFSSTKSGATRSPSSSATGSDSPSRQTPSASTTLSHEATPSVSSSVSPSRSFSSTSSASSTLTRTTTRSVSEGTKTLSVPPTSSPTASSTLLPTRTLTRTHPGTASNFPNSPTVMPTSTKAHSVSKEIGTPTHTHHATLTTTPESTATLPLPPPTPPATPAPPTIPGCETFLVNTTCYTNTRCYWSLSKGACVHVEHQALLLPSRIDGFRYVRPTQLTVDVSLWGGDGLVEDVAVVVTNANTCGDVEDAQWLATPDATRLVETTEVLVAGLAIPETTDSGMALVCARGLGTHLNGSMIVTIAVLEVGVVVEPTPILRICSTDSEVFSNEDSLMTFAGHHLQPTDTFAILKGENMDCNSTTAATASAVSWSSSTGASGRIRLSETGSYTVCYRFRDETPTACPWPLVVSSAAPWTNVTFLTDVESLIFAPEPIAHNVSATPITVANTLGCQSLKDNISTFLAPQGTVSFGGFHIPEVCMLLVAPKFHERRHDEVFIAVEFDMSVVHPSSKLLLVDPRHTTSSSRRQNDGVQTVATTCDGVSPSHPFADAIVLQEASGYTSGTIYHQNYTAVFVFCGSADALHDQRGVVVYRAQSTRCPKDCLDATGTTQRGTCNTATGKCECKAGHAGPDCSAVTTCAHPTSVSALHRVDVITHSPAANSADDACTYAISIDKGVLQTGPHAIGLRVVQASFLQDDCATSYVEVQSPGGILVRRICPGKLETADQLLVDGATSANVIFRNAVATVQLRAVRLFCGRSAGEGCGNRGFCFPSTTPFAKENSLVPSTMVCMCVPPLASTAPDVGCDTCAVGFDTATFPECLPVSRCRDDCSGHGVCTSSGCECEGDFFGVTCSAERAKVQHRTQLDVRMPFDEIVPQGNAEGSAVDPSTSTCERSRNGCLEEKRTRGGSQSSTGDATPSPPPNLVGARRSFAAQADDPVAVATNATGGGLRFNKFQLPGSSGDYVLHPNASNLLEGGAMTLSMWVQLTPSTSGILAAMGDHRILSDGRLPPFDAIVHDAKDRHMPVSELILQNEDFRVNWALLADGAERRLTFAMMKELSNPKHNRSTAPKEDWIFARHFSVEDHTDELFDGSWRYLVLTVHRSFGRDEAQVFVDAETLHGRFAYVQCLPFGLKSSKHRSADSNRRRTVLDYNESTTVNTSSSAANANTTNWNAAPAADGAANNSSPFTFDELLSASTTVEENNMIVIGYLVNGSIDEIRMYDRYLHHRTIAEIGGESHFMDAVSINVIAVAILVVMLVVSLAALVVLFIKRLAAKERVVDEEEEVIAATNPLDLPNRSFGAMIPGLGSSDRSNSYRSDTVSCEGGFSGVGPTTPQQQYEALSTDGRGDEVMIESLSVDAGRRPGTPQPSKAHPHEESANEESRIMRSQNGAEKLADQNGSTKEQSKNNKSATLPVPKTTCDEDDIGLAFGQSLDGSDSVACGVVKVHVKASQSTSDNSNSNSGATAKPPSLEHTASPVPEEEELIVVHGGDEQDVEGCAKEEDTPKQQKTPPFSEKAAATSNQFGDDDDLHDETPPLSYGGDSSGADTDEEFGFTNNMVSTSDVFRPVDEVKQEEEVKEKKRQNAPIISFDLPTARAKPAESNLAGMFVESDIMVQSVQTSRLDQSLHATLKTKRRTMARSTMRRRRQAKKTAVTDALNNVADETNNVVAVGKTAALGGALATDDVREGGTSASAPESANSINIDVIEIIRDTQQYIMLYLFGWSFPPLPVMVLGSIASIVSLTFDALSDFIPFHVGYYLCFAAAMVSITFLTFFAIKEFRMSDEELEDQLLRNLQELEDFAKDGKHNKNVRSKLQYVAWAAILLISTVYLPVTRNSIIVIFCLEHVQCVFDCNGDAEYNVAYVFAVLGLLFVSIFVPMGFIAVTLRKKKQFKAMTVMSGNDTRDDLRWQHFLRADPSFFRPIYTSYNLENCYFQAVLMLMKTVQVVCVLGPEANTVTQLALVTVSQCAFGAFFAVKIPYRLPICNVIMMSAEVVILSILGLSLVYLLNSDNGQWELGFGVAICTLGIILLLVQIRYVMYHHNKNDEEEDVDEEIDKMMEEEEASILASRRKSASGASSQPLETERTTSATENVVEDDV